MRHPATYSRAAMTGPSWRRQSKLCWRSEAPRVRITDAGQRALTKGKA
jgi:hypothetical protein